MSIWEDTVYEKEFANGQYLIQNIHSRVENEYC